MDDFPSDIIDLANQLGFRWPDESAAQIEVLARMARLAKYWRDRAARLESDENKKVYQDRLVQHIQEQNFALRRKLKNVRKHAQNYMRSQRYWESEHRASATENSSNA